MRYAHLTPCKRTPNGAPTVGAWLDRVRVATGPNTVIRVRIDAAGDCTAVMRTIDGKKAQFLTKARTTGDLAPPSIAWRAVAGGPSTWTPMENPRARLPR
jgi:hypothetical protein